MTSAAALSPPPHAGMSDGAKMLIFSVMALGMFMALLDIQIVAASLPEITSGLAASADQGSWIQTSYLVAEIVMIPFSAILSQAFSTRWVFTASAAAFTLASVACGLSTNLEMAIFLRAVQGFTGGAMIPTVFATGYALFQGPKQALIPAILGMTGTLAPVIGPSLGGYITDLLSWRWLFFINVLPGIAILILVPIYGKIDDPDPSVLKGVDPWGLPSMAGFLGGIIYVLEEGPRYEWLSDPTNRNVAIFALICGVVFFYRSLTHPKPVVNLRVFQSRRFTVGALFQLVTGMGLFSSIYLVPQYLAQIQGYRSLEIGKAVAVVGVAQLFATPLAAKLSRRLDPRVMVTAGFLLFAASTHLCSEISSEWGGAELLWPQALRGFSLMFCIVPATNLCLGSIEPRLLKAASGLTNLMRNLGGAIGIAAANTILNDRFRLHFTRLVEELTPRDLAVAHATGELQARATHFYGSVQDVAAASNAILVKLVEKEARTMAFADSFHLLTLLFLGSLVLVLFTPPTVPPAISITADH